MRNYLQTMIEDAKDKEEVATIRESIKLASIADAMDLDSVERIAHTVRTVMDFIGADYQNEEHAKAVIVALAFAYGQGIMDMMYLFHIEEEKLAQEVEALAS